MPDSRLYVAGTAIWAYWTFWPYITGKPVVRLLLGIKHPYDVHNPDSLAIMLSRRVVSHFLTLFAYQMLVVDAFGVK